MTTVADRLSAALSGRYRIERELGAGGMATVYLAEDLKHDRKVAIKVLKPELAAVLGAERFVVEIKTTAALQHPHILPLFDSGTADGFLFYVMPYIEGETIREKLNRETQFGVDDAVRIAREVADALDYAHRHGVIHRDIKPENILLHDGRAMVMDFGIALAVSAAAGGRMTETGLSLGTPHYMSPEQATAEKEITPRSDVYSLASVLYEMLAGQPPHVGGAAQQVIMKIITEPALAVTSHRKNVPPNVVAALAKALEKLPADRFENAKVFGDALGNASFTTAHTQAAHVHGAGSRAARRRLAAQIAAAAVAGAVLGAAVLSWLRPIPALRASRFTVTMAESTSLALPGTTGRIALSPDGSRLAFIGRAPSGRNAIFLRSIGDPVPRVVPGTEGALSPSFSPDGSTLLFVIRPGHAKKLLLAGGPPIGVADSADLPKWGDGGQILFTRNFGIFRVSADGGPEVRVAGPDSVRGILRVVNAVPLPGGTHALVTVHTRNGPLRLATVSIASGTLQELGIPGLAARYDGAGHILFAREDGSLFAAPFSLRRHAVTGPAALVAQGITAYTATGVADFAVADDGTLALARGDEAGSSLVIVDRRGVARPLPDDARFYGFPRVSPDGRHIALEIREPRALRWDVWVYDVVSRTLNRVTSGFSGVRPGGWMDEGRKVVYVSIDSGSDIASGRHEVRARNWDGSGLPTVLLRRKETIDEVSAGAPHGYLVLGLGRLQSNAGDIWAVPIGEPGKAIPVVASPAIERYARVSPNGKFVAYVSNETGTDEVYVRPIPSPGGRLQVSNGGGDEPVWAPGDRELFYRTPTHLVSATLSLGADMAVARRDTLFADPFARGWINYDVFPNGREFVMIRERTNASQLEVILNWHSLLRK